MDKNIQNYKVQLWVSTLGTMLFIIKIAAYLYTNSLSILADALESIINVVAGFIGLLSLYIAKRPKDNSHPYGHGKVEFVSAGFEGTLVWAAGAMVLYDGIQNFFVHRQVTRLDLGMSLDLATALINATVSFFAFKLSKKNNSPSLAATARHLLIDACATIAIVIGLLVMFFTHWAWLDTAIPLCSGIVFIWNGFKIIRSALAGIMDEADRGLLAHFIKKINSARRENWIDLHNLRIIKYGSNLHVDCHQTLPWYLNVNESHNEVELLLKLFQQEFGNTIELFVHTDPCMPFSCPICSKPDCGARKHPYKNKIEWTLENIVQDKNHNSNIE